MSALYLAAVVLCAPPATETSDSTSASESVLLSAKELREAFRDAVRTSYQGKPSEAVPKLVSAYKALEQDKRLSNTERADLKTRIRSRMIAMGDRIVDDARRALKKRRQEEAKAKSAKAEGDKASEADKSGSAAGGYALGGPGSGSGSKPQGAAGGPGQDDADELIELIRRTIRPESWDVNGGPGTIMYYRPSMALVITQTEEVHWLIGGLAGALRQ